MLSATLSSTFRLGFALTLLASQISFAQHPASELRPGKPVERRLAGGGIQSHKMNLIGGQYVGLRIEQKGIDVSAALFGPDGTLIGEFGRQSGYPDREDLAFLPTSSGTYRLEVRPAHQDAAEGT